MGVPLNVTEWMKGYVGFGAADPNAGFAIGLIQGDYFEHEVWNDTDRTRVVLFFDVTRPLKPPGALVNRAMLAAMRQSGYVKDAKRNALAWDDGTGRGFDG